MNYTDVESKQEAIYMTKEDKLRLLDNFPELKREFEEMFLGKFADRHEEEAKFWDQIWERQKEKKTLLYGGIGKDDKIPRDNFPSFSTEADNKLG
jgi:hypothetical protein